MVHQAATEEQKAAEALFNELNYAYEDSYGNNPGLENLLKRLSQELGDDATILDVGCGTGHPVSSFLAQRGCNVTGIDVSQAMVDICQSRITGQFVKVDMAEFEPSRQYDGIFVILSMFQMSFTTMASMAYKFASWLRPGGLLCIGTVCAPDGTTDGFGKLEVPFMGEMVEAVLLTETKWLEILQQAGLIIKAAENISITPSHSGAVNEKQFYITAERQDLHPLLGPYPLPTIRRSPHQLSQTAWQPFAERLTRHEFDAVMDAVEGNREVLDVGSGHGELPIRIAERAGKAYAIEPNRDRNGIMADNGQSAVEIAEGSAEALPYEDNRFDAVVAMWILHYVDDLGKSLREMVRVVNPTAPNARIVLVQGAPDNEVVNLINKACAPIAELDVAEGVTMVDHQGYLLSTACDIFRAHGFGDITLEPVPAYCGFPEEVLSERCARAADVLANFWYLSHPRLEEMKTAFVPILESHFKDKPFQDGDQAVILVARPTVEAE